MLETPGPVITAQSEENPDGEVAQISPLVTEETTTSEPPASADPPPTVIHCEEPVPQDFTTTAKEILGPLARLIGDKCMAHRQGLQGQIDQKLQGKINEKKQALGLKTEVTQKANYQTEETYEMSM